MFKCIKDEFPEYVSECKLYELDEAVTYRSYANEVGTTRYIITSYISEVPPEAKLLSALFGLNREVPETVAFPATEDGRFLSYEHLSIVQKDEAAHEEAVRLVVESGGIATEEWAQAPIVSTGTPTVH